jgi:hypothetical protein
VTDDRPKVIPQAEPSDHSPTVPWEPNVGDQAATNLNPFRDNYVFNTRIMGYDISYETRAYFLRTTPLYLRGTPRADGLDKLLKIEVQPHQRILDLLRHLRIYIRCETFYRDRQNLHLTMRPAWLLEKEMRRSADLRMYTHYKNSLECLRHLPFSKHAIKLEICILHDCSEDRHGPGTPSRQAQHKYNLIEAIKPLYFFAKNAGANISVRCENFNTGFGEDVSWELDLDADLFAKVKKMPQPTWPPNLD